MELFGANSRYYKTTKSGGRDARERSPTRKDIMKKIQWFLITLLLITVTVAAQVSEP